MNEQPKKPNIQIGHTLEDGKPTLVVLNVDGISLGLDPQTAEHMAEELARQAELCQQPRIVLSS